MRRDDVIKIVEESAEISLTEGDLHRHVSDLGVSSLQMMEIFFSIENRFHVKLYAEDVLKIKTVQDIIEMVESKRI